MGRSEAYPSLSSLEEYPVCKDTEHRWWTHFLYLFSEKIPPFIRTVQVYDPFSQNSFQARAIQKLSPNSASVPNLIILNGRATGGICGDLRWGKIEAITHWWSSVSNAPTTSDVVLLRMPNPNARILNEKMERIWSSNVPKPSAEKIYKKIKFQPSGWFVYALFHFLEDLDVDFDKEQLITNTQLN